MRLLYALLIMYTALLWGCKKEEEAPPPDMSVSRVEINEGNTGETKVSLTISLSKASSKEISMTYSTENGTAKAGEDYNAIGNGVVTITPGTTSQKIDLIVIGDNILEFNESFYVNFDNVTNANLSYKKATITIVNDDSYTPETATDGFITPNTYPGMSLVWSDEFNRTDLDLTNWSYETGGGGWGNNELETYTNSKENVFCSGGYLTIKAISSNSSYTSGRIITKGKKEFKYGRIDIRAKLPYGKGVWPALWMLGANISTVNWPACGEIDIMELLGQEPAKVYGTAHWDQGGHKYSGSNYSLTSSSFSDKFHIFTLLWNENYMEWYVDYQQYYKINSTMVGNYPFNSNQFFIFNVAVGGNWPGSPDASTVFPQSMLVDYVRVFQ